MENIVSIKAREILDSRGDPTVEVEVETQNHIKTIASVPSGASVGAHEVIELRDGDEARFGGMGVLKAVENVNSTIASALSGQDVTQQKAIDDTMSQLDGTPHKSKLGANAILAVSLACAKAAADSKKMPLYKYIAEMAQSQIVAMPRAMFNFIEGAKHADNNLVIQEFLVIPEQESFKENYRKASEVFHKLRKILKDRNLNIAVGHEGGFAPQLPSDEDAIRLIQEAEKINMGLDLAGVVPNNMNLEEIVSKYPVISMEDPVEEDNWDGWVQMMQKIGSKIMIVGDDLLATNMELLKEAVEKKAVNAVIVKPNQIGTISDSIAFSNLAKQSGLKLVVSHRSGETEDTFIADFAVGVQAEFCKFGAPSRGERVAKYNRLLRIEEEIKNG
ncbi:MAG: enolase [Candidatus Berkelbacteria bacterium]|nr:enolase [Candidatus Berkelbacteria bacterium]